MFDEVSDTDDLIRLVIRNMSMSTLLLSTTTSTQTSQRQWTSTNEQTSRPQPTVSMLAINGPSHIKSDFGLTGSVSVVFNVTLLFIQLFDYNLDLALCTMIHVITLFFGGGGGGGFGMR